MTNFRYDGSRAVNIDDASDPGSWAKAMADKAAMLGKADMVNSPPHYKVGGVETIDYIEAKLTPEEFRGYCKGNALKYVSRAGHKADAAEDTRKAIWYLNRLLRNAGS